MPKLKTTRSKLERRAATVHPSYLRLIRLSPLRPLRTDEDLDAATAVLMTLTNKGEDELDAGEADYLNTLTILVGAYEAEHVWPEIDSGTKLTDADILLDLCTTKGITRNQLSVATGISGSTLTNIANGKRRLTREQVQKVSAYFGVDSGLFEYPQRTRRLRRRQFSIPD